VRQTQRIGLFPKTAIKKFVGLFVALSLYTHFSKSKNSFCSDKSKYKIALDLEPRFGQPRGAPARAERSGFVGGKSMGRPAGGPPNGRSKIEKSNLGVSL